MPGEKILIIDDSKYMVSFLADTALPALGYKAMVATNGRRGLELVAAEKPDLVLLDLNLPDMTGVDVVRNLVAAGNKTAVILMTAYGSEQIAVEAFRLGVRDYLTKPVELDDLASALQRALFAPRLQRDKRQLAEELHRTNRELQRQVDQVATFASIGRAITASLDLERILTRVIEAAIQLCQAEEATIWLLEGSRENLVMVAEKGMDQGASALPRLTHMRVQDALAGEAVRTRQPIIQMAERNKGIKVKTGYLVKSVIYVPMLIQDSCLGVVSVANRVTARPFHHADLVSLQALADYAAIAIENARLYRSTDDALQKRLAELAAISDISEAVATLDLRLLLQRAIGQIHQTFNVAAAILFLFNKSRSHLVCTITSNSPTVPPPRFWVPVGGGIVGKCAQRGESYLSNAPADHPMFVPQFDQGVGLDARSLLVVPLRVKERVVGVIELINKQAAPFDQQDASLLTAMATPVAVAVENVHLFDQIRRERATSKAVLDGSPNPIMITDKAGRLSLYNPAARALFNLAAGDANGRPLDQVIGLSRLADLVATGQMVTDEIEYQGQTFIASVSPIVHVGSAIELQDITYLKELDKAKSEFVTTVTHDLRSPLTAIVGFIELLPVSGPLTEQQQEFVAQAIESTHKMRHMINDMLDLARIESGLTAAKEPCDLLAIATQVVNALQGAAKTHGVKLSLFKRGQIPTVMGHADQLERALENLVGNATKYTAAGGHVRVGLQAVNRSLYVAVLDNGRGIPEKDQPHVFEKFYRVEEHRDTAAGSGLGLAMVKSIVETHNGTISLRSQIDKGSTFTIVLPL